MKKWQMQIDSEHILERITERRIIDIFDNPEPLERFDTDLYFKIVDKIVVYAGYRLIVSLLDGSEIECGIE